MRSRVLKITKYDLLRRRILLFFISLVFFLFTRDISFGMETSQPEEIAPNIRNFASAITVKVLSGNNQGSGFLINHQDNIYTVVTNDHVLLFGRQNQSYQIKIADGKVYPAQVVQEIDFQHQDLGLLQFQSKENYQIGSISDSPPGVIGEEVYAAGFPAASDNSFADKLLITQGTIQLISEHPFRGGYQIGYTNTVKKGMSGGPLLNSSGMVIGINGRHKYPLWGNPYIFDDGTVANAEEKSQMSQLSWAIPIHTFLRFMANFSRK